MNTLKAISETSATKPEEIIEKAESPLPCQTLIFYNITRSFAQ